MLLKVEIMNPTSPIGSNVAIVPPYDADRVLREGAIKSSPPPTKVHPMHNETTSIAIRKEFSEHRRRATVKIRSAEIYNQADALDRFAAHLEDFVSDGKIFLQAQTTEDREKLKEQILHHLEKIEADLKHSRSIDLQSRDNQREEREAGKEPEPVGLKSDIKRLKARLQDRNREPASKSNEAHPAPEESPPASQGAWLKVMEDHSERLRDIEAVLRDKARKAVRALEEESGETDKPDFFDRTLHEIREARSDIEQIRRNYRIPRDKGDQKTVDDDAEDAKRLPVRPGQTAEKLVRETSRYQVIRAQELLTPEAVGELVF